MVKRKNVVSPSKFMHFHDKQSWMSKHKKHLHTLPLGGIFIHCLRRVGKSIVDGTFCSDLSHKVVFARVSRHFTTSSDFDAHDKPEICITFYYYAKKFAKKHQMQRKSF